MFFAIYHTKDLEQIAEIFGRIIRENVHQKRCRAFYVAIYTKHLQLTQFFVKTIVTGYSVFLSSE